MDHLNIKTCKLKVCDRCLHIMCEAEGSLCNSCRKDENMRRAMETRPDTEDDGYPD